MMQMTAEADRRFSASPVGLKLLALLQVGSPSQRQLCAFILRDPIFVATHGIEDMARETGISPSTLSRFVQSLNIAGYAEFRGTIGSAVRDLVAPVTKLGEGFSQELEQGKGAAERSLGAAAMHMQALADQSTIDVLRQVVGQMARARQVWVMGFGLTAHLAEMLVMGLQPYRDQVQSVVQAGGTEAAAARLVHIGPEDMLISMSFPRYSAAIVPLTQKARDNGAHIVTLTDSSAAPLASLADDLLLAPAQHPVISSSSLPGLALIEALVSEFLLSDPAHLDHAQKLARAMSDHLIAEI